MHLPARQQESQRSSHQTENTITGAKINTLATRGRREEGERGREVRMDRRAGSAKGKIEFIQRIKEIKSPN